MRNDRIAVRGVEFGVMEAIGACLMQSPEGRETELYGYALHVEVAGTRDGRHVRHTLTHTHPPSDGSVPEWAGLRAYTRNVGIPLAIGAVMLAEGRVARTGVLTPEEAFEPQAVFAELRRRQIFIHEEITATEETTPI
jgi:saccharopine dehydrogenase-like NADP-dependent oxidoreductase